MKALFLIFAPLMGFSQSGSRDLPTIGISILKGDPTPVYMMYSPQDSGKKITIYGLKSRAVAATMSTDSLWTVYDASEAFNTLMKVQQTMAEDHLSSHAAAYKHISDLTNKNAELVKIIKTLQSINKEFINSTTQSLKKIGVPKPKK